MRVPFCCQLGESALPVSLNSRPSASRPLVAGALAAFVVMTSACTTLGPDYQRPQTPLPDAWTERDDPKVRSEAPDYGAWWKVFGDPVLDDLIDLAHKQNLNLRIAGVRILEARAQLGVAIGSQYPQQQTFGADLAMNQLSENAPNQAGADGFNYSLGVGFDASWEIDFWGRFRRGIEAAEADLVASVADYDDILVSLLAEVARDYVVMRTYEERIELAEQNVKIQERSMQIADVRFRNGVVTELDVTQARSLLRNTQALVPSLEIGRRQAQNALATLLGITPLELRARLGDELGHIPAVPTEAAVGIPAELLRRRPDIRQAELAAASQSAKVGIAESDLYPRFALLGSIGLQTSYDGGRNSNNADFGDLLSSDSLAYSLGPSFQWSILNYGRIKNQVRVQDARLEQLLVNYQNTVLRAVQEVEDATVGFLRAQDQAGFLGDSVEASQRSVDLSLIQYRDGVADYTRVLNSQDFLVQQQDAWTSTRGNIATNLVAMYKALGGGWELRQGQPFVPEDTQRQMGERTDWGNLLPGAEPAPEDLDPPAPARDQPYFQHPEW